MTSTSKPFRASALLRAVVTGAVLLSTGHVAVAAPTRAVSGGVSYYGDPSAPDMSGVWRLVEPATTSTGSKEGWRPWPAPLKPAFATAWRKKGAATGKPAVDPVVGCMPAGMPRFITADLTPLLIVQTKGRVLFYRDGEGPRRVWLDGRAFPAPADLETFLKGTGIGHYEGSDLLIETRGVKDQPIDGSGTPHSDQLKIMERYHKVDDNTLKVDVTLIDPVAYAKPLSTTVTYKALNDPSWTPVEFICKPGSDYHPDKYVH